MSAHALLIRHAACIVVVNCILFVMHFVVAHNFKLLLW